MVSRPTSPPVGSRGGAPEAASGPRRALVVSVLAISLAPAVATLLGADLGERGDHAAFTHTLLEWSAFGTALYSVALALVHFRVKGDVTSPLLCMGLFTAGTMDLFHALLAEGLLDPPASGAAFDFIGVTWLVSRFALALTLLTGVTLLLPRERLARSTVRPAVVAGLTLALGLAGATAIWLCAQATSLPTTIVPGAVVPRPWDVVALALYAAAGLVLFPLFHSRQGSPFSLALWLSAIPAVATQLHMGFGSTQIFDHHFMVAHALKAVSYAVPGMGLLLDYVELYRREARLHVAFEARNEEARLLLAGAPDAILAVDEAGRVVRWNPRAEALFGWSAAEVGGRPIWASPQGAARAAVGLFPDLDPDALHKGPTETRGVRRTGESFPAELVTVRTRVAGTPQQTIFVRDITERKQLEQHMMQSEKLSAMGMLVAGVAHELNNPLQVVVGYVQLLKDRCAADPELLSRLARIEEGAERARVIVSNLTTFARQQDPRRGSIEANETVRAALEWVGDALATEEVEVELDLDPDLPRISADRHQLAQVLVNLLLNATQALRERPQPRRIRVATSREPSGRVRIRVEDNGPGIPPAERLRVFDPFFTTRQVGEGTGLGLSIAFGIVERHGGRIWVTDASRGVGAAFVVELPEDESSRAEREPEPPDEALHPVGGRALVVDDDAAVLAFLADALAETELEVEAVESGREALERISRTRYDLVLCDLRIPDVDGREIYEHLCREQPELASRFVLVTGDTLSASTLRFLEATGVRTLEKPVTVAAILRVVRKLVRESKRARAAGAS